MHVLVAYVPVSLARHWSMYGAMPMEVKSTSHQIDLERVAVS